MFISVTTTAWKWLCWEGTRRRSEAFQARFWVLKVSNTASSLLLSRCRRLRDARVKRLRTVNKSTNIPISIPTRTKSNLPPRHSGNDHKKRSRALILILNAAYVRGSLLFNCATNLICVAQQIQYWINRLGCLSHVKSKRNADFWWTVLSRMFSVWFSQTGGRR